MKATALIIALTAILFSASCSKRCKANPKPNCYCTKQYDPVCGCDNVTYGNGCEAECAGVTFTEGPCEN